MTGTTDLPAAETTPTKRGPMARLFDPRSIAVVGASTDPAKRGYQSIRALQRSGYRHPIHPVNPRATRILGLDVAPSVEELPRDIDVALIALPGPLVPDALRACAGVGIRSAVVLANGFKESGHAGAALEAELAAVIAETGIRVIGPNTSGIINASTGANLVGLLDIPQGPISVVTQSGNMLLSLVNDDRALQGPGFHVYAGLGNQVDVSYADCLTAMAEDDQTGAIAVHAEGLIDGRGFLVAAARAVADTPVVMVRGGRSEIGRRTALSHTGSVAGSDAVATAVLRQAGVELVDRSDELAVVAEALAATVPVQAGRSIAILADGGGHATLAADALAELGVSLANTSEQTQHRLRQLLGDAAAVANPVDVAGATDADPTVFVDAARILMADPAVGLVLIVGMFGGYHLRFDAGLHAAEQSTADRLADLSRAARIPLVVQSCYAAAPNPVHARLRTEGFTVVNSIDHAARIVAALTRRGDRLGTAGLRSDLALPTPIRAPGGPDAPGGLLDEPAARRLVEASGIDLGAWAFARTADEAAEAVEGFDHPCALKIVSPQVVHKSDVGGVQLGVLPFDAADRARAMIETVAARAPGAEIDGLIVSPMARPGIELLVGAMQDPIFGPVVVFGSGGVLVEALKDVTFRAAPFTELEAREMIDETAVSRMLDGHRHLPRIDRDELARLLVRIGDLIATRRDIDELDLNPVIASADGLVPADVRIVLTSQHTGAPA
ncbi:CoA-binding domain protein OS=Tsukamurella paurometabola (strain ATCC 8368 / DSM / CCUG 35730/ CIP 100753 / JCM 10117 / KCTC 9821 / NBRC 16120 / NCIMB 702349 / NCTC 13040) OX=521096 GN=Tpau_2035 PE=4 SV=1 [Tsukamurella paurometabola]